VIGIIVWGPQALISVASLALRRPWTAVLSRRRYPEEFWATPLFHETNMVMSAAWSVYFILATVCTAVGPLWTDIAFGIGAAVLTPVSFLVAQRYADWRLAAIAAGS